MSTDFISYDFELTAREKDTILIPITLKQNDEYVPTSGYSISACILNDVYLGANASTIQKLITITSQQNDYKDGLYTVYIPIIKNNGVKKTIAGKLQINKGKQ